MMDREILDLLRRQGAVVQPQIVDLPDERLSERLAADPQRRVGSDDPVSVSRTTSTSSRSPFKYSPTPAALPEPS